MTHLEEMKISYGDQQTIYCDQSHCLRLCLTLFNLTYVNIQNKTNIRQELALFGKTSWISREYNA